MLCLVLKSVPAENISNALVYLKFLHCHSVLLLNLFFPLMILRYPLQELQNYTRAQQRDVRRYMESRWTAESKNAQAEP